MQNTSVSRAVRGAITVDSNTVEAIGSATVELLERILNFNDINNDSIVSVIFTLTPDLNADFPAKSAREQLGWDDIPMVCASEIPVPGSIEHCIRVMITFNTLKTRKEIKHVYLREAQGLRPDLV